MTDEGIGVYLVNELAKLASPSEALSRIQFEDLGTSGLAVLHNIAGKHKAVIIDCALMGEPPGTIRRFTPDEVSPNAKRRFSLHEGDLFSVLELSQHLDEAPAEIILFGIEPYEVVTGRTLSEILASRVPEYLKLVAAELNLF